MTDCELVFHFFLQNIFDSKKKIKAATADELEHKLTSGTTTFSISYKLSEGHAKLQFGGWLSSQVVFALPTQLPRVCIPALPKNSNRDFSRITA